VLTGSEALVDLDAMAGLSWSEPEGGSYLAVTNLRSAACSTTGPEVQPPVRTTTDRCRPQPGETIATFAIKYPLSQYTRR
jgi:hypothetical protein